MKIDRLELSVDDFDNEAAIIMSGYHGEKLYRNSYLIRYVDIGNIYKIREGVCVLCDWFIKKEEEINEIHNRD